MHMLCALVALCLLISFAPQQAQAQQEDRFSMNVTLNSDQFFGFYPFFSGGYSLSERMDLTFYGILWSGGTGAGWGNWTEFGMGLSFQASEAISITPQVGVLGGSLLSSGGEAGGVLGDGLVPNLTVALGTDQLEGELYFGYYAPLREEGSTLAFTHYWLNAGYKALPFLSFGGHWEHLILSGGSDVEESSDVYQWLGPYLQLSNPNGSSWARFSFGTDVMEENDSFYKLTVGLSL